MPLNIEKITLDATGQLTIPRGTTLPVSGMVAGDLFYKTDTKVLYAYDGVGWAATGGIVSHNHSVASGSGAIATDQIAKFGDGGVTNYAELQASTGKFRAYGTGRWKRAQYTLAPNMAVGGSLTFNGNSYNAATYTLISSTDRPALFRAFTWTNPLKRDYVIAQTVLPADYVAGTDFQVCIAWCAAETTGNVVWTLGLLGVSDGDSYNVTPTYTALAAAAVSGTAYGRVTTTLTVTGTGYNPGDCIPMVLLRVAGSGSDTLNSTAFVAEIGITYIADKLGADVA